MSGLHEHTNSILTELARIQTAESFPDDDGIPGTIGDGGDGQILVTASIEQSIREIATQLKQDEASLARRFSHAEWRDLVRKCFGPALAAIDLDNDLADNAYAVLAHVRAELQKIQTDHGPRQYAVGCTLFSNTDIDPIILGPVQIEARLDWLKRNLSSGAIDAVTARRVERVWQNGRKLRPRKNVVHRMQEKDILDVIGNDPFVCSVQVDGLAMETGKNKALTAGRMALAAIALLWERPSNVLQGFYLKPDQTAGRMKVLTYAPDKTILSGGKLTRFPSGYRFRSKEEWQETVVKREGHLRVAGEILEYALSPTGTVARPDLMNVLMQALPWFHEACREPVDAMAVVKFVSVMDGLAMGSQEKGIRKLITAQLGFREDTPIRNNGPTMKDAVKKLYGEGRSHTVHGISKTLAHDMSDLRSIAEILARHCLAGAMHWASKNPMENNPRKLREMGLHGS